MVVFLYMKFGGFFCHWWKTKSKKSAKWIWISTVQCTQEPSGMTLRNHTNSVPWMLAVTSTSYHEWPRSHQLRTMNECSHTNSVPWMNAVTPTPYHECTQFVDSVEPLLFRPIAYIYGTELVWQRSFMVRSWCDLVSGLTEYKNQHKVTLASQSDFRSY
jgi:hypothetical protein